MIFDVLSDHPQYRNLKRKEVMPSESGKPAVQSSVAMGAAHPSENTPMNTSMPGKIKWLAPVKTGPKSGYMLSECGKWSIVKEDTIDFGVRYGAFSRTRDFSGSFGWRKDLEGAEGAKELCEQALANLTPKAPGV